MLTNYQTKATMPSSIPFRQVVCATEQCPEHGIPRLALAPEPTCSLCKQPMKEQPCSP